MKNLIALTLTLSLALGSIENAQADWGRHERAERHRDHHHHHEHRRGQNWAGPAALLAITGLAIGAAAYNHATVAPVQSFPAYTPPPQRPIQMQPESGNWYYCESSGQYYPYVRYCPEGWLPVMPPR